MQDPTVYYGDSGLKNNGVVKFVLFYCPVFAFTFIALNKRNNKYCVVKKI